MAAVYTREISIVGKPTMTALVTPFATYPVGPIVLDSANPTLAADVVAALNAADPIFAGLFMAVVAGEVLTVTTKCTPLLLSKIVTDAADEEFSQTACNPVIQMEIAFDCNNRECLNFTDKTKAYDAVNNLGGYGGANWPAIADILSVYFLISDDGDDFTYNTSGYLPTAAGTNQICLKASDFAGLELVPGKTYSLIYTLNMANDEQLSTDPVQFTVPCCGDAIPSNLTTDWSLMEKLGRTSMDFTDTTGAYDADDNPGGYGGPNPDYDDITSTVTTVKLADGTIKEFTDFIPTADNPTFEITNQMLGYGDGVIPPQIITVGYDVYIGQGCRVGEKIAKTLIHGVLYDCLTAKGKSVVVQTCSNTCNPAHRRAVLDLWLRYQLMLLAAKTNIECVADELADLYYLCRKDCVDCQ